ncbi:MAG: hypothetical protein U0974_01855 [Gemmatimonadales bacterium]|nr:hypothetical protein [Gemmatimonadales bacterium]
MFAKARLLAVGLTEQSLSAQQHTTCLCDIVDLDLVRRLVTLESVAAVRSAIFGRAGATTFAEFESTLDAGLVVWWEVCEGTLQGRLWEGRPFADLAPVFEANFIHAAHKASRDAGTPLSFPTLRALYKPTYWDPEHFVALCDAARLMDLPTVTPKTNQAGRLVIDALRLMASDLDAPRPLLGLLFDTNPFRVANPEALAFLGSLVQLTQDPEARARLESLHATYQAERGVRTSDGAPIRLAPKR